MTKNQKRVAWLKKNRFWWIGGLFLLCAACFLFGLSQQDSIREAVVRDEIASWRIGAGDARPPAAVFVSVNGHDPSNNFLRRFRGAGPVVYKVSQGQRQIPGDIYTEYWVNPASGLRGSVIPIGNIVWLGPFAARVEINYSTYGSVSTVIKGVSGWTVISRQMTWLH